MTQAAPTLVRRQLGRRLRRLRIEAGKTHEDVAVAQIASRTKTWRIEQGRMAVRQGDVLALARLYGLSGPETDELVALADATRGSGFLEEFGADVPDWVGMYAELEAASSMICEYNCELITGLLQTADYARTVIAANGSLSPEVIDRQVDFRMRRQRAFFERRVPGRLRTVLTAGAFGLAVGSLAVMEAQIAHLRAVDVGERVSVRVLSATNGVHAAMRGPFVIMEFDDEADPAVVHLENLIGGRYVERADHVAEYRRAFDRVWAQAVPLEELA